MPSRTQNQRHRVEPDNPTYADMYPSDLTRKKTVKIASTPPLLSPNGSYADIDSGYARSSASASRQPNAPSHTSRQEEGRSDHRPQQQQREDLPPIVTYTASTSSIDTYNSICSDDEGEEIFEDDDEDEYCLDIGGDPISGMALRRQPPSVIDEYDNIPPVLPPYRASVVDPFVRPSTPQAFGRLFPSLDRLSVRHDDLTIDGNMNLRIDTIVPASALTDGRGHRSSTVRRPVSIQLFHLRMHDLARREFSLRRYCRESGREVCSSKRAYTEVVAQPRPAIRRSVSSALRSVKTPFQRSSTNSTHHPPPALFNYRPSTSGSGSQGSNSASTSSERFSSNGTNPRRRGGSVSTTTTEKSITAAPTTPQLVPTETIRLEFSNYARVDVTRRPGKGYEFEWWGHRYVWRRVVDHNVGGAVSFHLVREGAKVESAPVAHLVQENRSPNQVRDEEDAGGWVPPCHLWISEESVLDAATDITDVIVSTGLIALVDDCIKQRWPGKNSARRASMGQYTTNQNDEEVPRHRGIMGSIFNRRNSDQYARSPLRFSRPVAAC